MTLPAQRKRQALKKACVKTWKKPAANAPTPTPRNMKPSWLMVLYASTFLMSFCTSAIVAAKSAVAAPMIAMTIITNGDSTKMNDRRQMR